MTAKKQPVKSSAKAPARQQQPDFSESTPADPSEFVGPQSVEQRVQMSMGWQGPLPPPGAMRAFNDVIPNGADRIMLMVEKEQDVRLKIEKQASDVETYIAIGGRLIGALLLVVLIGAAIWSIHVKADWKVTTALLGIPLLTLVAKFFSSNSK